MTTKILISDKLNHVLILNRGAAPSYPHTWDFPGGLVEVNEDPNLVIVRETFEETGLSLQDFQLLGVTKFRRLNVPTLALVYLGFVKEEIKVQLSAEHSDYIWVKLSDLSEYELQPWLADFVKGNKKFIIDYIRK